MSFGLHLACSIVTISHVFMKKSSVFERNCSCHYKLQAFWTSEYTSLVDSWKQNKSETTVLQSPLIREDFKVLA